MAVDAGKVPVGTEAPTAGGVWRGEKGPPAQGGMGPGEAAQPGRRGGRDAASRGGKTSGSIGSQADLYPERGRASTTLAAGTRPSRAEPAGGGARRGPRVAGAGARWPSPPHFVLPLLDWDSSSEFPPIAAPAPSHAPSTCVSLRLPAPAEPGSTAAHLMCRRHWRDHIPAHVWKRKKGRPPPGARSWRAGCLPLGTSSGFALVGRCPEPSRPRRRRHGMGGGGGGGCKQTDVVRLRKAFPCWKNVPPRGHRLGSPWAPPRRSRGGSTAA